MITDRDLLFLLYGALRHQRHHPIVRLIAHHLKIPEDKYLTTDKMIQKTENVSTKGKLSKEKKDMVHLPRRNDEFIYTSSGTNKSVLEENVPYREYYLNEHMIAKDPPPLPDCLKTGIQDDYKNLREI
jgi:hypothetical protein